MTLPFRGRHHDAESSHDRARALSSEAMLAPLPDDDATWLTSHLETCGECRSEQDAWQADRQLLRSLRDRSMEPPRDLWARTSAAIDREARGRRRRHAVSSSGRAATRDLWRGLPLGAAAGALVVLVVVGASILGGPIQPNATPGSTQVANNTILPEPTNIELADAGKVGWIRQAEDGTWELVLSEVDEVCPRAKAGCESLGEDSTSTPLDLDLEAGGVTISPDDDQLVVALGADSSTPGRIYIVPVPTKGPTTTQTPPATQGPTGSDPIATPVPTPDSSPVESPIASPGATPAGAIEIATGVTMVGEPAYSADGQWLAFSARPADNSTGPDLYLWRVGDSSAVKVTDDHQTWFSSWLGGRVLASRVLVPGEPVEPGTSPDPAASPESTPTPTPTPEPTLDPAASPGASASGPEPMHPSSFLLDPVTLVRTDLTQPDVWLPVVDPDGRFTAYWAGTLVPTADGLDWQLAEGQLVLDEWLEPGESPTPTEAPTEAPSGAPSVEPTGTPEPTPDPAASADPSAAPVVAVGPAGRQVAIAVGPIAAFQAKFDPEGFRVAIWTADRPDAAVGRLHLVVLDPVTGTVDAEVAPLPGVPALRRFSIDFGRLAWVSPPGQDGQESAVQVLGWLGDEFGEIQTIPARDLFIVR